MERWGGKMLIKEECLEALEKIKNDEYFITEDDEGDLIHIVNLYKNELKTLRCLIHEYFDNPSLNYTEIEEGKWYWHNKKKEWVKVLNKGVCTSSVPIIETINEYIEFELNCFYRKQVKE